MFDLEFDNRLNCYCLHFAGEIFCLGAGTLAEAQVEAKSIMDNWE